MGLADVSAALGHPARTVTPTTALFALFDPVLLNTSPQTDALALAKAAIELDTGDARTLEAHLGWQRRRFNPAFALLLGWSRRVGCAKFCNRTIRASASP